MLSISVLQSALEAGYPVISNLEGAPRDCSVVQRDVRRGSSQHSFAPQSTEPKGASRDGVA